ncbi:hypothetical protein SCLCIDRAFT_938524 [Scleroderma citrinum Foug A]|uniref:Uncharacterized protein n=1 Tax=Scleroderma citrinum Foug A TaxID=1036808 RepID=A0A0C3DIY9_9AGAM|nr:hypothetical protein SCLCIDRAFT_938524 [Scleroderma citrinum Foug A]
MGAGGRPKNKEDGLAWIARDNMGSSDGHRRSRDPCSQRNRPENRRPNAKVATPVGQVLESEIAGHVPVAHRQTTRQMDLSHRKGVKSDTSELS